MNNNFANLCQSVGQLAHVDGQKSRVIVKISHDGCQKASQSCDVGSQFFRRLITVASCYESFDANILILNFCQKIFYRIRPVRVAGPAVMATRWTS